MQASIRQRATPLAAVRVRENWMRASKDSRIRGKSNGSEDQSRMQRLVSLAHSRKIGYRDHRLAAFKRRCRRGGNSSVTMLLSLANPMAATSERETPRPGIKVESRHGNPASGQ